MEMYCIVFALLLFSKTILKKQYIPLSSRMRIPAAYPCVECKGRKCHVYYGTAGCPWRARMKAMLEAKQQEARIGREYEAYTTQPFIGRIGYPHVRLSLVQPLNAHTPEDALGKDHPTSLAKHSLQEILRERLSAIQPSWQRVQVRAIRKPSVVTLQAVSIARKPVLTHVQLKQAPRLQLKPQEATPPYGLSAPAVRVEEAEHASAVPLLQKVTDDTDLKAADAVRILTKRGIDEYRLTGMLSTGNLGVKSNRRLVPTRWSITAVDDMLGRDMFNILMHEAQPGFLFATGGLLGNEFIILVIKHHSYGYELLEYYTRTTNVMHDYELGKPRTAYADETAGGYYAARKSILEGLVKHKVRGLIITIRLITPAYAFPLGVWVVRKAAENAMRNAQRVASRDELLGRAREALHAIKPGLPLAFFLQQSKLWAYASQQRQLKDYAPRKTGETRESLL